MQCTENENDWNDVDATGSYIERSGDDCAQGRGSGDGSSSSGQRKAERSRASANAPRRVGRAAGIGRDGCQSRSRVADRRGHADAAALIIVVDRVDLR